MTPELATQTAPARTGATTPHPSPGPARLDALLAELAIAEKWPTAAAWCYRCDRRPGAGHLPRTCEYGTRPVSREHWIDHAVYRALDAAGLLADDDELSSAERRAQRALMSPLVRELGEALVVHARLTA
jgi:hypothetical protein